ncbi:hypothetical protein B9Z55_018861 [Caenorhabditis nigoni]|uniref:Uncharacterized protein n=1 Tax=Caenorhabditis nigoni TaxID=1611254 RepID=A0A2G5TGS3_9PELO|nr:hypothetical protein B9Z55_018861 [Caenorhabditis nigoni]
MSGNNPNYNSRRVQSLPRHFHYSTQSPQQPGIISQIQLPVSFNARPQPAYHPTNGLGQPAYVPTSCARTLGSVPRNTDTTFPPYGNNRTVTPFNENSLTPIDRQRKPQNSSSSPQLYTPGTINVQQSKPRRGRKPSKQSTKKSHGSVAAIPQNYISPAEQQLQDELERMRQEDERADREREEKLRRRNEERLRKAKEMQELMDTNFRKENELEAARRLEAKRRMDEEMNSLKRENAYKDRLKQQAYQKELFELKREGDQERKYIEDQRERERMEHEKVIMEKDRKFEEDAMMYEREEHLRKEELIRIQEEHEERTRLIYEEMERKMEELRKRNEEKMKQMRKQWEQIQKMLQMKVWNVIIENNWTNRLNVLRNSNRNIMDLFKGFYAEASKIQRHCDRSEDVSREIQRIIPVLNTLIGAVEQVESLMAEESEVLYDQWQNTRKSFVYYIKDSVDKVKYTCGKLRNSLKNYEEMLKKKPTFLSSEHEFYLTEIKKNFDDVSMYSNKIPTLAELKRVHSNDMRSETPSNNSSHELVPFQTVIIEEID